ncbi:MAG: PAS domain-containing protein, partial [Bacteroidales bacterium]|nr:PAS domain-containing protein [Bacteroidales bacterium]
MTYTTLFWGADTAMLEQLQSYTTQKITHVTEDSVCECDETQEILLLVELEYAESVITHERFSRCFSVAVAYNSQDNDVANADLFNDVLFLSEPDTVLRMRFELYNKLLLTKQGAHHNGDKYKDFFYQNDIPVIVLNNQGILIEANNQFLTKTGYIENELYNKPYTLFFQNFDFEHNKKNGFVMANLVSKQNELIPKELHITRIPSDDEDVFLVVCHSISKQIDYVQQIQYDEIRFRSVITNSPNGLLIFKDNKITFLNEMALLIFGGRTEEFLQKDISQLVIPSQKKGFEDFIAEQSENPTSINKQFTFLSVNHEEIFVKVYCKSLSLDGEYLLLFQDISELMKSKELIANQEFYLNEMQTMAKIGHYEVDFKSNTIYWSREMYSIYNISSKVFTPSLYRVLHYVAPDDVHALKKCYNQAKRQPGIHEITYRLQLGDKEKWIYEKLYGVFSADGEIQQMVGWLHDISDTIVTKQALELTTNKYTQLFENLSIGFLACSIETDSNDQPIDYIIQERNPACEQIWSGNGIDFGSILNKSLKQSVVESNVWIQAANEVYKTHKTVQLKYTTPFNKTIKGTVFMTFDKSQMLAFIEDVSEQEAASQITQKLTKRLKKIQDYARIGTLTIHANGEYYWNKVMYQLFEYNTNVKPSIDLYMARVHPEDKDSVTEAYFNSIQRKDKFLTREVRLQFNDGRVKYLYTEIEFFYINGEHDRSEGWLQDITARRITELQLIAAKEKAEESDRLKSSFLANMSHEIRTPLNAIVGFSTLLVRKNYSEEKRQLFLDDIQTNSRHLLTIINDILDISKIESEQMELSYIWIDLNQLMQEINDSMQFQIKNKEVSLFCQKTLPDSQVRIYMDDVRLKQILTNLISNAIKFTAKGFVHFGYTLLNDTTLEFFVKDTGVGIAPENHNEIFEYFRQEDGSTTRKFGGTGLGLTISKRLIELMGGKIWVESEKGHGAQFFFTLPYVPQDTTITRPTNTAIVETDEDETILFNGETILVIDDHEASFVLIAELFAEYNVTIEYASSGRQGIEYVEKNPSVALIFMDIHMPQLNGVETMRILREKYPNIPIIAQTAFALKEDRQKYLNA